jgi:hypothetical protein
VGPAKKLDQFLAVLGPAVIHILVDGFMTNMQPRMFQRKPSSNDLRRPAEDQFFADVEADSLVVDSGPAAGLAPPLVAANLGPARTVEAALRRSVPA